jgi:peptidoglycan/LPS O-acetylase OafA/YrhL
MVLVVSAEVLGTPLDDASFIVPVTVGAFASLVWDFGVVGFMLFVLLGVLFAWAEARAFRTPRALPFIAWVTVLSVLSGYLQKGDLIYNVLNWGLMLAFVVLSYAAAYVFLGRERPVEKPWLLASSR